MKLCALLCLMLNVYVSFGQLAVPYVNTFDSPTSGNGWSHSALSGTDDWELGTPSGLVFNAAYTVPSAWKTNIDGGYTGYSSRVLVTPSFDLTSIPSNFSLSFIQKRHSSSVANYFLEYSVNNGVSWTVFNPATTLKKNWQTASGFTNGTANTFYKSAINLSSLQGQSNVMFRFRFVSNYPDGDGWLIDDFAIKQEYYNVYATQGDTIESSQNCAGFTVSTLIEYDNAYTQSYNNTTKYFFSVDNILDAGDLFLGTRVGNINASVQWDKTFSMIPNLNAGDYYIFYQHDATNVLNEDVENDNVGFAILHLDSIFEAPYSDDFESTTSNWKTYLENTGLLYWERGAGYSHYLEKAHSGLNAWHTSKSIIAQVPCGYSCNTQYLESPYFDLVGVTDPVVSFYYKSTSNISVFIVLQASADCGGTWTDLVYLNDTYDGEWHDYMIYLPVSLVSSATKFRVKYMDNQNSIEGISIDDFYVGSDKADLSIERDISNRNTSSSESTCNLKYYLTNNSGNVSADTTITKFYWSSDSIFDASDIYVGFKVENIAYLSSANWVNYVFTKPTTQPGRYYLFYFLDSDSVISETREYNNFGYFTIYQNQHETVPFFTDFENTTDGWHHNSSLSEDDWKWGTPYGVAFDTAFSGVKAFYTSNDSGYVSPLSRMHLYTPVFDFSNAQHPVIFFDMLLDADGNCSCYNANTNMSYSIDGGATWQVLDTTNRSYNRWYYSVSENGFGNDLNYYLPNTTIKMFQHGPENVFATVDQYNGKDASRNTRYVLDVTPLAGQTSVQFRYNLVTDFNTYNQPDLDYLHKGGALIDNFGISESFVDLTVEYKKALMISSLRDSVAFYMWVKNNGLAISNASTLKFYTSIDTTLDASDYLLGTTYLKSIRPDLNSYVNRKFKSPPNLGDYKYLIYSIDPNNSNIESNESNNTGFWNLALDSIHEYPYFNDFNDTIVDGWYQYSKGPYGDTISNLRFRNQIAPGEPLYFSYKRSGEWFTDRSTFGNGYSAPKFFLQSPAFSFEHVDSVKLSFDLFCAGGNLPLSLGGGQMQFSTDGGDHFTVLTPQYGAHHNWYNFSPSIWWFSDIYSDTAILDSTYFDLTFLRGEKNVVLQFTFQANETQANVPHGMRMDNFLIEGIQLDYHPLDSMVDVAANISVPTIDLNYSISNIGDKIGRDSKTKFYWSSDEYLDSNDILLDSVNLAPILMNDTLADQISLIYPVPIANQTYYIFYQVDTENNVKESIEVNNTGSFKIHFDAFVNYRPENILDSITILDNALNVGLNYSVENAGYLDGGDFETVFYWSENDQFEATDSLIGSQSDIGVLNQNSATSNITLDCVVPYNQNTYYVFFYIDENDSVFESDETDNVGVIKIKIQSTINVDENSRYLEIIGSDINSIFINLTNISYLNSHVKITNVLGQEILCTELSLVEGVNKFSLPNELVYGMYFIQLDQSVTKKLILGTN